MTIGDIIKILIKSEDEYAYRQCRKIVSDDTIKFIKEMLPSDYEYFAEKEENYQEHLKNLNDEINN